MQELNSDQDGSTPLLNQSNTDPSSQIKVENSDSQTASLSFHIPPATTGSEVAETNGEAKRERYSCDVCRKYKKKCSKELPACDRCRAKGIENECFYPGKSRRRTKAEMEIAKFQDSGEEAGISKRKFEKYESGGLDKDQTILLAVEAKKNYEKEDDGSSSSNSYTPLSAVNHGIRETSYAKATLPIQNGQKPNTLSSILKAARSPSPPQTLGYFTSPFGIKNGLGALNPPQSKSFIPPMLSATDNEKAQTDANDYNNSTASIPIAVPNIQYETVASIFKGGQPTSTKQYVITKDFVSKATCAYFRHNHRIYPMIHKLKFNYRVSQIDNFTNLQKVTADDEYETFKFMLYFMLAIGATTLQRAGSLDKEQTGIDEYLAYLAMKRFKIVMKYQNLNTIRSLILLGVYSFFEPKGISAWTIGGIICRLCIGLGLNNQLVGKKKLKFSEEELELRNRCYWSTYCFEKLVHLSLLRGDGGLEVNDSDVPFPKALYAEEEDDIKVNHMMINLRILENDIFQSLHTIRAGNKYKGVPLDERLELITKLQSQLDATFQKYKDDFKTHNSVSTGNTEDACGDVSFHRSELWLVMRYEQFQILLYRPSKVLPRLPADILNKLGTVCLSSLRHNYMLYQQKKMPFNWVTLFRALNVCNATCVCLYNWSIDLNDCEREFKQIIEVLTNFGPKWRAAKTFARVFQNISQSLLQFSLHVNDKNEDGLQQLNFELFGPNSEYYDIMDENDVDISWLDFIKE